MTFFCVCAYVSKLMLLSVVVVVAEVMKALGSGFKMNERKAREQVKKD